MQRKPYPERPILSVDDEAGVLTGINVTLRQAGVNNVHTCQDSRQVQALLSKHETEAILLDLYMPHISGEELLTQITRDHPEVPVIVITGASDVETAVRCMKCGAFDYLTKPVENGPLIATVKRAIEMRALQRENEILKEQLFSERPARPRAFQHIISINHRMVSIFQYLNTIAVTVKPLLITGETGTGKELAAQAVHAASGRTGEFVVVNVGGLSDHMFEDTLFGHVRGAYTGAERTRSGMIEKAAGGTLMLDEIGDLNPASQAKLLRFLQTGEYQHLGEDRVRISNARIIALTNKDLWKMEKEGAFRSDLIFRLKTHHVHLPPLRDRQEDLTLLIDHFIEQGCQQLGKPTPKVPKEIMPLLESYHFPGNVRELQTIIFDELSAHHAKTLSLKRIKKQVFQSSGSIGNPESVSVSEGQVLFPAKLPKLKRIRDILVNEAMRRAKGNQSVAAAMLGITPAAICKRLKNKNNSARCADPL